MITMTVPHNDGDVIAVESWEQNKNSSWPTPQLSMVKNGSIEIVNTTDLPISVGHDVKNIRFGQHTIMKMII